MAKEKTPYEKIFSSPPGSTEWLNAFDQLNPQDQAAIYNFGSAPGTGGEEDFVQYDDSYAPVTDEAGMMMPAMEGTGYTVPQAQSGVSLDPLSQQILQFGGGVGLPQYTSTGKLDPYDLSQEAQRHNLYQDQVTALMDIGMAGMAGPGAIDPASFAPQVTKPTDRLKTPGLAMLREYAQGTGYRAFLARKMLPPEEGGEGLNDDEALSDLWKLVNEPDDEGIDPKLKAQRDSLINSLPANTYQSNQLVPPSMAGGLGGGGRAQTAAGKSVEPYNTGLVTGFASDLFKGAVEDRAAMESGWQDPDTGQWYQEAPVTEDSPATLRFHNAGLPTPVEQYTDPKYMQMAIQTLDPNFESDIAAQAGQTQSIEDEYAAADRASREADKEDTALRAAWDEFTGQRKAWDASQSDVAGGGLTEAMGALPENVGRLSPEDRLRSAMSAQPENQRAQEPQYRTAPAINLGGRIIGTKPLGDQRMRVQDLPAHVLAQAAERDRKGDDDTGITASVGDLSPQAPWVVQEGKGKYKTFKSEQEARKYGGSKAIGRSIFDFAAPQWRKEQEGEDYVPSGGRGYSRLSSRDLGASQQRYQQERKRFIEANTASYRNRYEDLDPGRGAGFEAYLAANNAARSSTPYQDAIMQRLLGQRAVGLRGA